MQSEFFIKQQQEKRKSFHEKVHAAYVLEDYFLSHKKPTDEEMSWLMTAYPGTKIEPHHDPQCGTAYFITPNF